MTLGMRLRRLALYFAGLIARMVFHYPRIAYAWARRLMGRKSFITEQIPGERSFDNDKFAIFLIWQPKGISWSVRNALEALAEAEINVVLVANHPLAGEVRETLVNYSRHILVRDNTGFDIGGYQDATNFIRERFSIGRLLYINDSVYFFREGLTDLFSRLASSKADLCTVFENWEFNYHLQSFCFSISRRIFDSDAFRRFWERYLPVNSRLWAIRRGEIALSRAIVPVADQFEVLYDPNEIRSRLRELSTSDLLDLNKYVPIRIRLTDNVRRPQKGTIEEHFIQQISSYSQVHTGGFLYRKFLRNPLIKRDLVYRVQYSIYDVESCLTEVGHEGHLQEILSDMRRKGSGNQLPLIKKIQFLEGII